jgi:hypothetical protein
MVSPCLNLFKAIWFKNTGSSCRNRATAAKNTAFISQAASLDDVPRKPLAALYAAGLPPLATTDMGVYCAEINDAALQYQDR